MKEAFEASPDVPLTEEAWRSYQRVMQENAERMAAQNLPERFRPPGGWDAYIAATREVATGPLPFFMELLCDPDGNVWIADYTNDRVGSASMSPRYRVVSAEGEWIGTIEMPAGVGVLAIGRDHILGVEQNEPDVQAISLYRIER